MDKNQTDKLIFMLVVAIFLIAAYVGIAVVSHIHNMSYKMGVMSEKIEKMEEYDISIMAEKIGTLEELVPLMPVRGK